MRSYGISLARSLYIQNLNRLSPLLDLKKYTISSICITILILSLLNATVTPRRQLLETRGARFST